MIVYVESSPYREACKTVGFALGARRGMIEEFFAPTVLWHGRNRILTSKQEAFKCSDVWCVRQTTRPANKMNHVFRPELRFKRRTKSRSPFASSSGCHYSRQCLRFITWARPRLQPLIGIIDMRTSSHRDDPKVIDIGVFTEVRK